MRILWWQQKGRRGRILEEFRSELGKARDEKEKNTKRPQISSFLMKWKMYHLLRTYCESLEETTTVPSRKSNGLLFL